MSAEASDIFDFVVKKGNGVKGLSQMDLKTVPQQYIQPPEKRLDKKNQQLLVAEDEDSIPIIDVSNLDDDPRVSSSICDAASRWGFFQIINHGIPIEVLENVKEATHKFFDLPNEERRKYLKENSPTPTIQLKTSFSPSSEKILEWKDYLVHHYVPEDHHSSNFWPSVSKEQVLEYMKWTRPLIKKLLEILLKGLNVKEIDEAKESLLMGSIFINIYYPKCPNPELTSGAGCHSDISCITVLLQDDVGGLYVQGTKADSWIHVKPMKGALVINIGDILQILSNDRYKSIEHRVIVNGVRNRVSVPIFVNSAPDAVLGPFPEVLEEGEKPIYKQLLYSDYFNYFFSKAHDGKKTIEFAKL